MEQQARRFLVAKDDLENLRLERSELPRSLAADEVLLAVDRFAFTANNISYAVFGRQLRYWDFFPAEEGWGCIPVWGFADVLASSHAGVEPGERLYGFWPMASHARLQVATPAPRLVVDQSPHRRDLPAIYNQYARCDGDPAWQPELEDLQALFRPLFATAFLAEDFLADSGHFGARRAILSSASSKTALATAWCLGQRGELEVVGLTSAGNRSFVEHCGFYDRVLAYEELEGLEAAEPSVYIDLAGNRELRNRLHRHLGEALRYDAAIGGAHWQHGGSPDSDLPGAAPVFFFAPDQAARRERDWGNGQVMKRVSQAAAEFLGQLGADFEVVRRRGSEAAREVYLETLHGRAAPERGNILGL